jgi:UDP-glucose 4-epimerase
MALTKILITGANGFIGNILCETPFPRDMDFVPVVRKAPQGRQFPVGDISAETEWGNILAGCHVVIHLAARVHVMDDRSGDPLAAFRAMNLDATMNLAKQAVLCGVKRFVFVSSVKVNGEETTDRPFTAFDEPAPIDPYGQSKFEAEIALRELSRQTGLEVVIVRPPLVYGPGVRANFLRLMQLVKMGIPLPFGAIKNRRSMVAADNLIDLLLVCARHPAAAGQTFLVSDDNDVSISELLRMLADAMGKRALLLPVPSGAIVGAASLLGKSDVANRLVGSLQVDISHTKSTLQWAPQARMADTLKKTVAHFLAHS